MHFQRNHSYAQMPISPPPQPATAKTSHPGPLQPKTAKYRIWRYVSHGLIDDFSHMRTVEDRGPLPQTPTEAQRLSLRIPPSNTCTLTPPKLDHTKLRKRLTSLLHRRAQNLIAVEENQQLIEHELIEIARCEEAFYPDSPIQDLELEKVQEWRDALIPVPEVPLRNLSTSSTIAPIDSATTSATLVASSPSGTVGEVKTNFITEEGMRKREARRKGCPWENYSLKKRVITG